MPPQAGAGRKRQNENMYFEPGVRGRKTGLTVPDTGIRDEMGMEPIDDLFSSPEKTIVMTVAPPPPSAPAMTAAVAIARKPPPAKTPKVAHKTPKLKPQPRVEAQAPVQRTVQKAPEQQKPQHQNHNGAGQIPIADQTNSMEESMQIGNSTMPEPTAVLTERRKSTYIPPPKSKSPTKTFLGSPARRHPSIQPISSPTRGDIQAGAQKMDKEPVARKLDFSNGDDVFTQLRMGTPKTAPSVPESPAPAQVMQKPIMKTPSATNGKRKRISLEKENVIAPEDIPAPDSVRSMPGAWEEPTPFPSQKKSDRSFDLSPSNDGVDEYVPQPMDIDGDVEMGEVNYETILEKTATPEPEPARPVIATIIAKKGKARVSLEKDKGKGKEAVFPDPEKKKLERPKSKEKEQEKEATISMKQAEQYLEIEASRIYSEDEAPILPPAKKSKLSSKDVNRKISIKKAAQLAKDVESSPVQIQRGPPRPRQNGLFILRRETPALSSFPAARVGLGLGRGMVKPSAYWRNEDEEGDTIFEPAAQQSTRKVKPSSPPQNKGNQNRRKIEKEIEEEFDLAEAWEAEPGRINGLVKEWNAADKSGDAVMEHDDEIALSGPAIITRAIPGSEVQFAKTLTLPFFGSGMVDLPPGAIKKPKNSRKMQMVFFVHKGNVKVTVNGNEFRISSGGMWQVPRGNFYSIENDYDKEARIFFSQGCEVKTELE